MHKFLGWSAAALIVLPAAAWSQQTGSQGGQPAPAQISAPQETSVAAAARKVREQKKGSPKASKVFTNDDISTSGGVSSAAVSPSAGGDGAAAAVTTRAASGSDEKSWRDKFVNLHQKLDRDKQDLEVMQRELGVLNVQYYGDPLKAMQQQMTREDLNKKTADIEAKKKDIAADQQAIDDAEDDLRKAGGEPGWAR